MEGLTRLVTESLARHGFDRPLDYRRLQWSRWYRCESLHSLLYVPSKPGVFALAEEVMNLASVSSSIGERESDLAVRAPGGDFCGKGLNEGAAFSGAGDASSQMSSSAADAQRRVLSVLQFFEDDDMAYVLDRMLTRRNPMSSRLCSGTCFVRFVVMGDEIQRRNVCNALNQWLVSTGEAATGIGAHFASSLELDRTHTKQAVDQIAKSQAEKNQVAKTTGL